MVQTGFFATVKSVVSGDTVVVTNQAGTEKTFSFAYVTAPRLGKNGDGPFAFAAREQLRHLALTKTIRCIVYYTIPNTGREYGCADLQDGTKFPDVLIQAGLLKVRDEAGRKESSEDIQAELERLRSLEEEARHERRGQWSGSDGLIEVQNELGGSAFFQQWKGKTVAGVVERVLSGDRLLTRLKLSDTKHLQVMTLLAGIRAPSTARPLTSTGATQPAEEYGNEARTFVEKRLLQRDVKVDMVGVSGQGQLIASVHHLKNGNIAEFLLAEGLARCNDFHSTMLGEKMAPLRAAEKIGALAKLRLHKNSTVNMSERSASDMTVSRIVSADILYVRAKSGEEKQIALSSLRGPRAKEPSEAPYRDEAKEFLRKKVIGKHVKVTVDGSRPASDGYEARDVATVIDKGKSINLLLVQEGYCSVVRHRKDDTDRSTEYDVLLAAQEKAKAEKKGMWSGKPSKVKTYVDASETAQKAKMQLSTLQRQKKVPGIVDFCKSGSRFTVLIPREGSKLTLVLAGIRAPRAPRLPHDQGERFGQDALDLAYRRCNQRDCEVDIHDIDKVGGFIGDLYINRESIAKVLVEEGLASVHQYSAERSGNAAELNAAESRAKDALRGMWHAWNASQEEKGQHLTAAVDTVAEPIVKEKKPDYREVVVTYVDESGRLKVQEIGVGSSKLEIMMTEFRKFHLDSKNNKPLANPPKVGEYVAAEWSGDFYRAKIRSNDRTNKVADVVFIDYGNGEKKPWSSLRCLDQPQFTVQKLKAQAIDCRLSFIQLPSASDYLGEAIEQIYQETEGKRLIASFDHVDSQEGVSYITLFDEASGSKVFTDSINRDLVKLGYARVPTKLKPWERDHAEILQVLREAEKEAKDNKLGMFEYGDVHGDDD